MAKTFTAFGRTITIDDEFLALLEKNLADLNDVFCEHYLIVEFGKNRVLDELPKYTDQQLSEIVKKQARDEVVV